MLQTICAVLLVIGGLNWGAYGLFSFDFVAWICGGSHTLPARVVYLLVGLAAVVWTALALAQDSRERRESAEARKAQP